MRLGRLDQQTLECMESLCIHVKIPDFNEIAYFSTLNFPSLPFYKTVVGGMYAEHTWVGTHRGTARHAYLHSFDIKKRDHDFNEEKVVSRQKPEQEERFPLPNFRL